MPTPRGGYICAHFDDSDPLQLAGSVRRLSELEDDVRLLFFTHGPWPTTAPGLLSEIAMDARRATRGELPEATQHDVVGNTMRLARGAPCNISLRGRPHRLLR